MKVIAQVGYCPDCGDQQLYLYRMGTLHVESQPWLKVVDLPDEIAERFFAIQAENASIVGAICDLFGAVDLDDLNDVLRKLS